MCKAEGRKDYYFRNFTEKLDSNYYAQYGLKIDELQQC